MNKHVAVGFAYLLIVFGSFCLSVLVFVLSTFFYFGGVTGRMIWENLFILCVWLWPFFGGILSRKSKKLRDIKWPNPGAFLAMVAATVLLSQIAFYSEDSYLSLPFDVLSIFFTPLNNKIGFHTLETQLAWAVVSVLYPTLFAMGGRAGYSVWNTQTINKRKT